MGRAPSWVTIGGLRKGPWSPEEDEKLVNYICKHGHSNWSTLPKDAGLARSGKSCRLRWTNYLRPDLKRGSFSLQEEETIIRLHSTLGNKWSAIAAHLPGRTDNEIKNYCNSSHYLQVVQVQETAAGSIVSSSSGTIVSASTAYTNTSSVSRPSAISTSTDVEAAMHFVSLEIHEGVNGNTVQEFETEEEHTRSLVQEFFSALSANSSIEVGDISVVERWLKELGVGWVLRDRLHDHDDGASAAARDRDARTWIRALGHIAQTFCLMRPLFPDPDSVGLPSLCQRQEELHVGERPRPVLDQYHLALFIQETMSKMLNFVDVIVASDPDMTEEFLFMDQVMPPPYHKLTTLLRMHDALSIVSDKILTQMNWSASAVEGTRIESEMASLLSECKRRLGEAIGGTMEKIRTMLMEDGDDSSSPLNPQGSSDIHKVTRSVMTYIRLLQANHLSVDAAMPTMFENERPFYSMIMEMVPCLQQKLVNISESFSDQGLRFLFLLNNSYFIREELESAYYRQRHLLQFDLNDTIKVHMERYLHESWALLSSCLFNPTPLCFGKNYSPLSKFESEFQKIYTTQKQWKVPNPDLRRRLRVFITNKIIPGYTEYIEDNKVTNPKFSPQELKAMLQELFEG